MFKKHLIIIVLLLAFNANAQSPSPSPTPGCYSAFKSCPVPVSVCSEYGQQVSSFLTSRLYILADNFQIYYREPNSSKVTRLTKFPFSMGLNKGFPTSISRISTWEDGNPIFLVSSTIGKEYVVTKDSINEATYQLSNKSNALDGRRVYIKGFTSNLDSFSNTNSIRYFTSAGEVFSASAPSTMFDFTLVNLFTTGQNANSVNVKRLPSPPELNLQIHRDINVDLLFYGPRKSDGKLYLGTQPVKRADGKAVPSFIDFVGLPRNLVAEVPGNSRFTVAALTTSGNTGQFWVIGYGLSDATVPAIVAPLTNDAATIQIPCDMPE